MKAAAGLLVLALASVARPASADTTDRKHVGLGADAVFTIPVGAFADGTAPLVGLAFRGGGYFTPQLEGYLRAGYQLGIATDTGQVNGLDTSKRINDLFVLLGGRYFLLREYSGLYASLELGLHVLTPAVKIGTDTAYGDANVRFGGDIGIGWVLSPKIPIDLGAQIAILNLIGRDPGDAQTPPEHTLIGINLLVGYELRF